MEIKIYKNEQEKICFQLNEEGEKEFNYDSFDYLIDLTYNNDENINFVNEKELDDYKILLDGIINESRKADYRTAVNKAKESKDSLEIAKADLDNRNEQNTN